MDVGGEEGVGGGVGGGGGDGDVAARYERDLVHKLKLLRHELSLQQPQAGHCRIEVSREEIFEVGAGVTLRRKKNKGLKTAPTGKKSTRFLSPECYITRHRCRATRTHADRSVDNTVKVYIHTLSHCS